MASLTKPDRHVLRLARLLAAEGFVARRHVELAPQLHGPGTAFDLLAVRLDAGLHPSLLVAECVATGGRNAPSPTDRVLWLAGARDLLGAQRAVLTTTKPASERVRGIGQRLGVDVLDPDDLDRRERADDLLADIAWVAADERLAVREQDMGEHLRKDEDLARVWRFVQSERWFLDDVVAVKRALGAIRLLARRYHEDQAGARRNEILPWLAHHVEHTFVLALARIAGQALRTPPQAFTQSVVEQLSEGVASFGALREISRQVDRYLMAVLSRAEIPPAQAAEALGVFEPRPPAYTETLFELIERFAGEPALAAHAPRFLDWRIAAVQLGVDGQPPTRLPADPAVGRLLRLVATFLRGQLGVPDTLLTPLDVQPRADPAPTANATKADTSADNPRPSADTLLSTEVAEDAAASRTTAPAPARSLDRSTAPAHRSGSGERDQPQGRRASPATRDGARHSARSETAQLVVGADEHHFMAPGPVDEHDEATAPTLLVAVHNVGTVARRVVTASAQAEHHGQLIANVPAVVRAGEETQLELFFSCPVPGLADGERVTLELTDDEGQRHHLSLRHLADGRLRADPAPEP